MRQPLWRSRWRARRASRPNSSTRGTAFPDQQFPVEAVDEFAKHSVPDQNPELQPTPGTNHNPARLAELADTIGAVLAGVFGNSHMFFQDKNNLQVRDMALSWIREHVAMEDLSS